jgi:hypothetical protein
MRRAVVLFVLLFLAPPAQGATGCEGSPPRGPAGLADTILVKGACGTFAFRRDGIVQLVHPRPWAPPWASGALARAGDGTYIAHPRRHLVLLRDAKVLWRSRLAHGSDDVVVHGRAIAFTAYSRNRPAPELWVARIGTGERLAASGEDLDGWARAGGFFTQHGLQLRLRATDGRLIRHLGAVRSSAYDRVTHSLFAISASNLLVRTDGRQTTALADLHSLGLTLHPWLELLPRGLIHIGSGNRLLLLRRDGTRFATASLAGPAHGSPAETIVSSILPLPGQRGVVFVVATRRVGTSTATDDVLLLERGRHVPHLLYERRTIPLQCGYWANLSLHGNSVLYWPSQGRALVALNTLQRRAPVDLWQVVLRTPGFRHGGWLRRAAWASAWND